jgi:hypothetical protein
MPGQMGLNAGILSSPGFTYANIVINYDAGAFNLGNTIDFGGAWTLAIPKPTAPKP